MLRELAHFLRNAPELGAKQRQLGKGEFSEWLNARIDEQGFAVYRRDLAAGLVGRVLEIGCGTGAMFPYYDPAAVVDAIEPDPAFRERAQARARDFASIRVVDGNAMRLDFDAGEFDAVLVSLVLCSVPSVEQVIREVHRVLRPGGRLRALEHVRSQAPLGGLLMHAANPVWRFANKQGCNMNRRPLPIIEAAGFVIERHRDFQTFDTLMPAFPLQRIDAIRA